MHAPSDGGHDKLTGARNENSVLFSLSSLTGAPGGGAAPAPERAELRRGPVSSKADLRALVGSDDQRQARAAPGLGLDDIMNLGGGGVYSPGARWHPRLRRLRSTSRAPPTRSMTGSAKPKSKTHVVRDHRRGARRRRRLRLHHDERQRLGQDRRHRQRNAERSGTDAPSPTAAEGSRSRPRPRLPPSPPPRALPRCSRPVRRHPNPRPRRKRRKADKADKPGAGCAARSSSGARARKAGCRTRTGGARRGSGADFDRAAALRRSAPRPAPRRAARSPTGPPARARSPSRSPTAAPPPRPRSKGRPSPARRSAAASPRGSAGFTCRRSAAPR